METVLLGIAIALLWGSADTVAAMMTQRIGSTATTLVAQIAGLFLVACVALIVGMPDDLTLHILTESMLSGIVLGAIGALAYLTLYKALEHGPLAVASPVVSAQGGVTLLAAIVVLHEVPGMWQMVFLLVTFVGVMLAAIDGRAVNQLSALALLSPGVALALVSMVGFGVLAFGLGLAARETSWLLCVVWTRIFSCLRVAFFGSAHTTPDDPAYTAAYETARLLAEAGFGIITNSTGGIMEAANRGACEGGMLTVACLLDKTDRREAEEEWSNGYLDVVLRFSRVASHQMTACAAAHAFVIFPGGLDTLESLCQAVRTMQAGERSRVPIVLYDSSFWKSLLDWMPDKLFEAGTTDLDVSDLFHLCDEPTEIAASITACLFPGRSLHQEGQQETELSITSRH